MQLVKPWFVGQEKKMHSGGPTVQNRDGQRFCRNGDQNIKSQETAAIPIYEKEHGWN